MGKLTFAGMGLGGDGISLESIDAIRESDVAYLEYYTSPHDPDLLHNLTRATGKDFVIVDRAFVEDGKKILEESSKKRVVILVQGDPMIATTHTELRVRALTQKIETRVIHGASVSSAAASEVGLHHYKFGRTVTYTSEDANFHRQAYQVIHQNLLRGLHTLLLLEFDVEKGHGVDPPAALRGLMAAESNFKREVIGGETFVVALSRIGASDLRVRAGTASELVEVEFGNPPHCVIVPGALHFTEVEAIAAITGIPRNRVTDNSAGIKRTAQLLVPKYVTKTKNALAKAKVSLDDSYSNLIENVELYMRDAEGFLSSDEDDLAMLSIGYAEGLLDSLTYTNRLRVEW